MPSPRRKPFAVVALIVATACLTITSGQAASASPSAPTFPSSQAVAAAKQKAADAADSVSQIKQQLAAADGQLQQLQIASEIAANAYDGAVYHWQQAVQASKAATARAQHALATAAAARSSLAGYVVSHETPSNQLGIIGTAMTANGPTQLIDQIAGFSATSSALDARYQQWQAASRLARVYQAQAAQALSTATALKQAKAQAQLDAAASVTTQQQQLDAINSQKADLVAALAKDEHISVTVAAQRAAGLERLRQLQLAAERRAAALAKKRAEEAQQRREQQQQHHTPPTDPGSGGSGSSGSGGGTGGSGGSGGSGGGTGGSGGGTPPNGGEVATAIAFARAQLGDPYVYGAAGPDAWDCSGLTMGSWDAAGRYLPHYSVAQYQDVEHISFDQLEPGDLVFWGSDSSNPYSIYHVALYIGGGYIIQAPHPGAYVEVSSIYDWILPNFYGRV